jgi:hypothetical protein
MLLVQRDKQDVKLISTQWAAKILKREKKNQNSEK